MPGTDPGNAQLSRLNAEFFILNSEFLILNWLYCPAMGNLIGDFRYALRSLARQPTFACVAILTLVLGIGTNIAIFSVIKAVLLNPLPYQDASRLVVVREQNPDGSMDLVAPLTFMDWKSQSQTVPALAAFRQ